MGIKRSLKIILESLTGTHIFRVLPHGISVVDDIARRFLDYRLILIFDVGANVGQSTFHYISSYPSSTIYSFEPISETFNKLKFNMEGKSQVNCFQLAFGTSAGNATMVSEGTSLMNCLLDENTIYDCNTRNTELVNISTLDEFCKTNNIKHISYLKIDTEGGDLDVLKGAEKLLVRKGVDLVEVEAGMNPNNKYHVPFDNLKSFLENYGYFIFGIYEQVPENKPHLRRVNTVFISEEMIHKYRYT